MNAAALGSAPSRRSVDSRWDLYKGWVLGLLIVVIILAVGAGFWFHYHP
jgi:hypothetical protein